MESTHPTILSEEIQEIINYRPGWLIRRGNIVFLGVLLVLLGISFLIRYPDVVHASVRITALNIPKPLTTKTGGRLERIFVTNGQYVKKGQHLACIQNTASYAQVEALAEWMEQTEQQLSGGDISAVFTNRIPALNELGPLQADFEEFNLTWLETAEVMPQGYYEKKKQALSRDIQYQGQIRQNLEHQSALQQDEYKLQQTEYEANRKLAEEKVIAPLELNQYKTKLLDKEQSLKQMSAQLINSDMASHAKAKELLDLQKYEQDQVKKFNSAFFKLKSSLQEWEQQYVLIAPEDGKLEFSSFLEEKQLLNPGQELFNVQTEAGQYYAVMKAGQNNLGKLKNGQNVIIRLESYPSSEFGYLQGVINFINTSPGERDSFLVRVDLPRGLTTNYGKTLLFRNSLSASGEVITDQRRLIERFTGEAAGLFKR